MMKCWAARNKRGGLKLFRFKPVREKYWGIFVHSTDRQSDWDCYADKTNRLFPEITWENSPVRVEIRICDKRFEHGKNKKPSSQTL